MDLILWKKKKYKNLLYSEILMDWVYLNLKRLINFLFIVFLEFGVDECELHKRSIFDYIDVSHHIIIISWNYLFLDGLFIADDNLEQIL